MTPQRMNGLIYNFKKIDPDRPPSVSSIFLSSGTPSGLDFLKSEIAEGRDIRIILVY